MCIGPIRVIYDTLRHIVLLVAAGLKWAWNHSVAIVRYTFRVLFGLFAATTMTRMWQSLYAVEFEQWLIHIFILFLTLTLNALFFVYVMPWVKDRHRLQSDR